jgi:hypothetical protein
MQENEQPRRVYGLNRLNWMKENVYVTCTKYASEKSGGINKNKTTHIGWKIKSLKNNILCLAQFPETGEKPEIYIDLTQPFEFNTPRATDNQGNKYIVEY